MINIFNIERFATHDGEGIRTTIFFQGCPLSCPWCANPESNTMKPVLLHDAKRCVNCRKCEKGCPKHAITWKENKIQHIPSLCDGCRKCEKICANDAISIMGERKSIESIMKEIRKDKAYYDNSNGGVTISGGEPFVQFKELMELLKALKQENYNVAVETTGHYDLSKLELAEPYIDTFLYDVKQFDDTLHKSIVGCDTKQIQDNLKWLCSKNANKVVLRIPVIPYFNYMDTFLKKVVQFASQYQVREVNLLPYHILGKSKFSKMGREYKWLLQSMNKNELVKYIKIAEDKHVKLKIGG